MKKEHEQLLAAKLAGENVDDALLKACRKTPELLNELAELTAIDRLLTFQVENEDDSLFAAEINQRLRSKQNNGNFVQEVKSKISKTRRRKKRFILPFALAASLAIGFTLLWGSHRFNQETTLANVTSSTGAVWKLLSIEKGDSLSKGVFFLEKGLSEITLQNGVRLILEAPIEFEIESVDLVKVHQGQLVANVPEPAIGFTILTPSSEIVDLGTEFGVSVKDDGGSEVHVLDGEVKARSLKKKKYSNLFKDDAMSFDAMQQAAVIQANPERFLRALPGHSSSAPQYLHWPCEPSGDIVQCIGTGIGGKFYPGALKSLNNGDGPVYQNGQFGEALYFNGSDAFVETDFPGIGDDHPRTVAFWAKVPNDFSINNGYGMISWGLMQEGMAWQISPNPAIDEGLLGRIRIGTMKAPVIGTTDLRDNRWHHIAVVMYGGDEANVSTHILLYVDGHLEKTSLKSVAKIQTQLEHDSSKPLMFGRNMAVSGGSMKNKRFFKGWLDEIYVFDTALDQQQIQSIMAKNSLN